MVQRWGDKSAAGAAQRVPPPNLSELLGSRPCRTCWWRCGSRRTSWSSTPRRCCGHRRRGGGRAGRRALLITPAGPYLPQPGGGGGPRAALGLGRLLGCVLNMAKVAGRGVPVRGLQGGRAAPPASVPADRPVRRARPRPGCGRDRTQELTRLPDERGTGRERPFDLLGAAPEAAGVPADRVRRSSASRAAGCSRPRARAAAAIPPPARASATLGGRSAAAASRAELAQRERAVQRRRASAVQTERWRRVAVSTSAAPPRCSGPQPPGPERRRVRRRSGWRPRARTDAWSARRRRRCRRWPPRRGGRPAAAGRCTRPSVTGTCWRGRRTAPVDHRRPSRRCGRGRSAPRGGLPAAGGRARRGCRHRTRAAARPGCRPIAAPGARARMKIGILSYHFPPEPAFVPGSLAEELAARGHEVRVLTGFPDYPGGTSIRAGGSAGGTRRDSQRLTVRRVPRYAGGDSSGRCPDGELSLLRGSAARWPAAAYLERRRRALRLRTCRPPTFAAAGLLAAARAGADGAARAGLWPATGRGRAGRGPRGRRGWAARCGGSTGAGADRGRSAVDAGPGGRRAAPTRRGCGWCSTGPTSAIFRPARPARRPGRLIRHDGRCMVMYAGNIGRAQGLESAVAGGGGAGPAVDLVFVGSGRQERRVRRLAAELGADNVRFVDRRSAGGHGRAVRRRRLPAGHAARPAGAARHGARQVAGRAVLRAPVVASAGGDTAGAGRAGPGRAVLPAGGLAGAGRPVLAGRRHSAAEPGPRWAGGAGDATCGRCRCGPASTRSRACCTRRPDVRRDRWRTSRQSEAYRARERRIATNCVPFAC